MKLNRRPLITTLLPGMAVLALTLAAALPALAEFLDRPIRIIVQIGRAHV